MVDSLAPSGIDPDNKTIITNSNDKLSVALDGETLAVGSSGKVEVFQTTAYLGNFDEDSGDWTGIGSVSNGIAKVNVETYDQLPRSASVTADLTDVDVLNFRIKVYELQVKIKVDGVQLFSMWDTDDFVKVEIDGLDDYGANTTVTIEAYDDYNGRDTGYFKIDYVRGNPIQPESRKIELVDTGGLP
jgi:hypothetical protein